MQLRVGVGDWIPPACVEFQPDSLVARGAVALGHVKRFLERVDVIDDESSCWRWNGSLVYGYGAAFAVSNTYGRHPAHRASFLLFNGLVPDGFDVDHHCHTKECRLVKECPHRACVRPSHLKLATRSENIRRGASRWNRETCMRGHPWTTENTVSRKSRDGLTTVRTCRICLYEGARRRYAESRVAGPPKPHHNAVKTHCPRGHPYTPENTIVRPNGSRACRACQRAANQRSKAKRRHEGRG